MDPSTLLELYAENAELRRDLAHANARPVILWTCIALALVSVFFGGAALLGNPQPVHHCSAHNINARTESDSGSRVRE